MGWFHKYSPQEWEKWLESLPPKGFDRFSKMEWISWHRAMSEAAGAVTRATTAKWWRDKEPSGTGAMSVLANKEPRARSSSSSRSSSASSASSLLVSNPPPPGPAQGLPAQGLPAQVHERIQLHGPTAKARKRFRSEVRAVCRKEGVVSVVEFSAEVESPPPLCNTMGVEWGKKMAGCHCELWPEWTRKNLGVGTACLQLLEPIVDRDGNEAVAKQGVKLLYWRSGRKNRQWWYNGSVLESFLVRFPTGRQKPVVALN